MKLKLIRGAKGAEEILTRIDPLDLSALPETVLARTGFSGPGTGEHHDELVAEFEAMLKTLLDEQA